MRQPPFIGIGFCNTRDLHTSASNSFAYTSIFLKIRLFAPSPPSSYKIERAEKTDRLARFFCSS
jgi:hypothetical protein